MTRRQSCLHLATPYGSRCFRFSLRLCVILGLAHNDSQAIKELTQRAIRSIIVEVVIRFLQVRQNPG